MVVSHQLEGGETQTREEGRGGEKKGGRIDMQGEGRKEGKRERG